MNRTKLSDGELAALLAHLKKTYTYDDEMGTLRKVTTGRPVGLKKKLDAKKQIYLLVAVIKTTIKLVVASNGNMLNV